MGVRNTCILFAGEDSTNHHPGDARSRMRNLRKRGVELGFHCVTTAG